MSRNDGWIPHQHGAWAMLAVPVTLGSALRVTDHRSAHYLIALVPTLLMGYLTYNALALLLKAPARRRPAAVRPFLIHGTITTVLGLATLALSDWSIAGWSVFFGPVLIGALALVATGHERGLLSGFLTTLASSAMLLVCAFPRWWRIGATATGPDAATALWLSAACFLYFFGTVFAVKSLIRERANVRFSRLSVGYHAMATALAGLGVAFGVLNPGWIAFFLATTGRAALLPWLARRGRSLRPAAIGAVETAFSVAALVLGLSDVGVI